jgi:hypothetical protein
MKMITLFILTILFISTGLVCESTDHQKNLKRGDLRGNVIEVDTRRPLPGVRVKIKGKPFETGTDANGRFVIPGVPVGSSAVEFIHPAYNPVVKTDIVIRSKRITYVLAELKYNLVIHEEVTTTTGYFNKEAQLQPISSISYSYEEIRRAPGSAGDISRVVSVLPGVGKITDKVVGLVIRGGSPMENGFFIDNIEIPNINHFPSKGTTSGHIGLLNTDFIQDVSLLTGGFSALYGDKLSSVMEIRLRDGNVNGSDLQFDLNMAGLGFTSEGPLPGKKGSWMFSGRRSFLELVADMMKESADIPIYSDIQGKINYSISENSHITLLGIMGSDKINFPEDNPKVMEKSVYGDVKFFENTTGINWFYMWGNNGYSNTSIAYSYQKYNMDFYEVDTDERMVIDQSSEQSIRLRNINVYKFNESNKIEFGLQGRYMTDNYVYFLGNYTDNVGNNITEVSRDIRTSTWKYSGFLNYTWHPFSRLTLNPGIRADYFAYNKHFHISPRFSFSYKLSSRTFINGAAGTYYQYLPLLFLFQDEVRKDLKDPLAYHVIFGIEHLMSPSTRLTVEIYDKEYQNFPLTPSKPSVFIVDEFSIGTGGTWEHEQLMDTGKARSYGIECMIQKKKACKFYGLISASYFRTRYRGLDGIWRNRMYDNRYIFAVEGGYKPRRSWEINLRWIFAGGSPFTPFDIDASGAARTGILDKNNINGVRKPDYHSLNLRFDKHFHFRGSSLTLYLSIWNTYNRKNIDYYYWEPAANEPAVRYQWGSLPFFGLEFEF